MKRENVRGDRLMNECLRIPRRGKCQFTTPSKCFKLKWCLERDWRGSTPIQSSPLFSSSNPSWVESEKHRNKLNKLFNHYPSDCTLPEHCVLHWIKIIATSLYNSRVTTWQQELNTKLWGLHQWWTSQAFCRSLCSLLHTDTNIAIQSCEHNINDISVYNFISQWHQNLQLHLLEIMLLLKIITQIFNSQDVNPGFGCDSYICSCVPTIPAPT